MSIEPLDRRFSFRWFNWPIACALGWIVARDYRLRAAGKRPDRWHWADLLMLRLGWTMALESE